MNFADNNARVVISLGIPFPGFKEELVYIYEYAFPNILVNMYIKYLYILIITLNMYKCVYIFHMPCVFVYFVYKVVQKRKYNDLYADSNGLLTGSQW